MSKEGMRKRFVFVAHWVETWNWLLWWNNDLHQNPSHSWRWMFLWPVFFAVSLIYYFGKKSYDIVDRFRFNGRLEGQIVLIRNFGYQFMIKGFRNKIRQRILDTVLELQKTTDVIGLGALTKAEWLTAGGKWIVDQLGDKLTVPVVHGDTLTAAAVIKRILQFEPVRVLLTGGTSKIGRAVALDLASRGVVVKLLTESEDRFQEIKKEAGEFGCFLSRATSLKDGADCPLWVTGKAVPAGKKLLRYVPKQAAVINFSVPNPINIHLMKVRPDLRFFEGGLIAFDPKRTTLQFNMRLWAGETYACHAGTMVHAYMGWAHNEVGPVQMDQLWSTWAAAEELGFFLKSLPQEQEQEASRGLWQKAKGFASLFF